MARHRRRDQRGIDAAGQEHPERHIGDQAIGDRGIEARDQIAEGVIVAGIVGARLCREVVPAGYRNAVRVEPEHVPGRQRHDPRPDRRWIGEIAKAEQQAKRGRVDAVAGVAQTIEGDEFGREGQPPTVVGIEQRFFAEPVARQHQRAVVRIPQREGEHADQPVEQTLAPVPPPGEQNLGVGLGAKRPA